MTVICCICQKTVGERDLSEKRLATSFVWRNHGLCAGCFDRARTAIARAYDQAMPDPVPVSTPHRPVGDGGTW